MICHQWPAAIYTRTKEIGSSGCPFCSSGGPMKQFCKHAGNLATQYPQLAREWHPDNPHPADYYTSGSQYNAKRRCLTPSCGVENCHNWSVNIGSRTYHNSGCPYYTGRYIYPHNSIAFHFPELVAKEWVYEKNPDPFTIGRGCNEKYFWRCLNIKCGVIYPQSPNNKIGHNNGCPHCRESRGEKIIAKIFDELKII